MLNMMLRSRRAAEARPTQPPHPSLIVDVPSGYQEDLGTSGTPDTVNIGDILSVDVTPLSSISTPCPDMSVAKSVSVDLGTSMSVDFDDRTREIQDTAAMSEFADPTAGLLFPKSFTSAQRGACQLR